MFENWVCGLYTSAAYTRVFTVDDQGGFSIIVLRKFMILYSQLSPYGHPAITDAVAGCVAGVLRGEGEIGRKKRGGEKGQRGNGEEKECLP